MNNNRQSRPVTRTSPKEDDLDGNDLEFQRDVEAFRECVKEALGHLPADWRQAVDDDALDGYPGIVLVPSL